MSFEKVHTAVEQRVGFLATLQLLLNRAHFITAHLRTLQIGFDFEKVGEDKDRQLFVY